ncbi:Calcium/proton exchanger [Mycena chlorophos]|uniref:Calcium/proton exchanger n=1 Tax=Mycena chlorophos TaxID=658473 RepID=A0A8H6THG9_MYCCL|nr:Calcium/proton exchanger [Mycena chlorophos]
MNPCFDSRPARGCCLAFKILFMNSCINVLLLFIPITAIVRLTHPELRGITFLLSVLSLVPLVKLHDVATREMANRYGGSKAGLLNASLSNTIEAVVALSALRKCELRVVQSSLIGSMLSKLLLVLGLCLFAGGLRFSEQGFDTTATQLHSSLLSLGVGVVLLPAAYHFALSTNSDIPPLLQMRNIVKNSRGISVILLLVYSAYLFFQLCSHTHLYQDAKNKSEIFYKNKDESGTLSNLSAPQNVYSSTNYSNSAQSTRLEDLPGGIPLSRDSTLVGSNHGFSLGAEDLPQPSDRQQPRLSVFFVLAALTIVTVAVAFTADHLVESMDSVSHLVPKPYVALIVLPAVNSITECLTAVNASAKDELNFALSVAVGSTVQTALFVIPLMVVLGWAMSKPLSMLFDPFESLVLYISVQLVNSVMGDGKSNYLEGMVLCCTWCIIAVSFWFYPAWSLSNELSTCSA